MRYTFQRYTDGSRLIRCDNQIVAVMERIYGGWLVTDVESHTDQYAPNEPVALDLLVRLAHRDTAHADIPMVA